MKGYPLGLCLMDGIFGKSQRYAHLALAFLGMPSH